MGIKIILVPHDFIIKKLKKIVEINMFIGKEIHPITVLKALVRSLKVTY